MKVMVVVVFLVALLGCGGAVDTSHPEKDFLHLEAKILLPGVSGRIDHLAYDSTGRRLFVAALANNTVEVVDLVSRSQVHSIMNLHEPQGVLYVTAPGRLVVAGGGDGVCRFYDGNSYIELGRVELGDDADNMRYYGSHVYVGYGSGGIAVIDPVAMRRVGELALQGHPESFQLGDSGKMWVNIPDAGEIVVGELEGSRVVGSWKNSGVSANFAMALDRSGGRLFVAYRHPATLRTFDVRTGAVLASVSCVGDADDVFYDAASGLVLVSGGDGFLDLFRDGVLVNHIATRKGARTGLWLPGERKFVLAAPARGGEEAALWVYAM